MLPISRLVNNIDILEELLNIKFINITLFNIIKLYHYISIIYNIKKID